MDHPPASRSKTSLVACRTCGSRFYPDSESGSEHCPRCRAALAFGKEACPAWPAPADLERARPHPADPPPKQSTPASSRSYRESRRPPSRLAALVYRRSFRVVLVAGLIAAIFVGVNWFFKWDTKRQERMIRDLKVDSRAGAPAPKPAAAQDPVSPASSDVAAERPRPSGTASNPGGLLAPPVHGGD